jgi:hypothetical protein
VRFDAAVGKLLLRRVEVAAEDPRPTCPATERVVDRLEGFDLREAPADAGRHVDGVDLDRPPRAADENGERALRPRHPDLTDLGEWPAASNEKVEVALAAGFGRERTGLVGAVAPMA